LQGLYDTSLKKGMPGLALVVALVSFGWIALQVEKMCRREARCRLSADEPITSV